MRQTAPIVLFVYNRPTHTNQTLEALKKNNLASESEIFIFCDGPKHRHPDLLRNIEDTREIVRSLTGFRKIHIVERDDNYGLARSVITGVTEIVSKFGEVIVLEDDLVSSPHFLTFMNDALAYYKTRSDIMHIQGYCYPVDCDLPETFLTSEPGSWGWATWNDRWRLFESDASKLIPRIKDAYKFDFDGSSPFMKMLKDQKNGKVNSWAICWYATAFIHQKLSVWPGVSLIQNIGWDGSGTHGDEGSYYHVSLSPMPIADFTNDKIEHLGARSAIIRFFRGVPRPGLKSRIFKKISSWLKPRQRVELKR